MKPSIKPSNSIGKIIPNIAQYKVTLWEAYKTGKKFRDFSKNPEINKLTETIGIWSAYVGYKAEENELILINKFIRTAFPTFNIEDVKEAVNMVGDGRIKTEYHGSFAPLYCGQVLNAFKRLRSEVFSYVRNEINTHNKLLPLPKPSPEETLKLTIQIIKNAHQEAIKGIFIDGGSLVYKHLLKHKLIDFSEENIKEAKAYAKRQITMKRKQTTIQAVIHKKPFKKGNSEYEIKMLMREFTINKWLREKSRKDMRLYLESLKPEKK